MDMVRAGKTFSLSNKKISFLFLPPPPPALLLSPWVLKECNLAWQVKFIPEIKVGIPIPNGASPAFSHISRMPLPPLAGLLRDEWVTGGLGSPVVSLPSTSALQGFKSTGLLANGVPRLNVIGWAQKSRTDRLKTTFANSDQIHHRVRLQVLSGLLSNHSRTL